VNITLLVVRLWEVLYREELIRNVTVLVVSFWGVKYKEELLLNIM